MLPKIFFPDRLVQATPILDERIAVPGTFEDDVLSVQQALNFTVSRSTTDPENVIVSATGLDGFSGSDTFSVGVSMTLGAVSDIRVAYAPTECLGVTASAKSSGIAGGEGTDVLYNNRSFANDSVLTATADAAIDLSEIILQIEPGLFAFANKSEADAFGLSGGNQPDTLVNDSNITTTARADSLTRKGRISAVEIPIETSAFGDARTIATATSIAMDGDMQAGSPTETEGGIERIINNGSLTALASANATAQQRGVELIGGARTDNSAQAAAYSAGLFGGVNDNILTNSGTLDVDAVSFADSLSLEFKMKGLMVKPLFDLFGMDVGTFETLSDAVAVGMSGNTGNDAITNTGTAGESQMDVYAYSKAAAEIYTFSVSPPTGTSSINKTDVSTSGLLLPNLSIAPRADTLPGDETEQAYGNARARATGLSLGMAGDDGNDTLYSRVALTTATLAQASNKTWSMDLNLSKTSYLPVPGAAVTDASTAAVAVSIAMSGGVGVDTVTNNSKIFATATADGDSLGVSAVLKGSVEGLNAGVSMAETGSTAVAVSKGMTGGIGGDTVENNGRLVANAVSSDDSTSISITLAGDKIGVAAGVTLADAKTRSEAYAIGLDGEDFGIDESQSLASQQDQVTNSGEVTVNANATANSNSVGFSVGASLYGVGVSVALAETETKAVSQAMGIRTGVGQDHIENNSSSGISATSTANSTSNLVNVAVSGAYAGVAMGAAFADSDTAATATATGIDAGDSNDVILSSAPIITSATANSQSNTINVNASVALKGFSMGAAATEAQTQTTADAQAIFGGNGNDQIENTGFTQTTAMATSQTKTITINFAEAGTAIADVSSDATANATGFAGGSGENEVKNSGTALVNATANTNNKNTTVNFIGYARADVAPTAAAKAVGMNSEDEAGQTPVAGTLSNQTGGSLIITATANADTDNHVIQGGGGIMADVKTTADAVAVGQQSGAGNDTVENDGTLVTLAKGEIKASNINFQLSGLTAGFAGINSEGNAMGMDAGEGTNTLINHENGTIFTKSDMTTTALNGQFSIGVNVSLTGVTAQGYSRAMVSGSGQDTLENHGHITATANTYGRASGASLGLVGIGLSTALADLAIDGMTSGQGNDTLTNTGTITVGALDTGDVYLARADTEAVSFNLISFVDTVLGARADLVAMNAGTGDDILTNSGTIYIGDAGTQDACTKDKCMVIGKSTGYGGQFLGAAYAYAGSSAKTFSTGMDGGSGGDTLTNTGDITAKARAYGDVDCLTNVDLGIIPSSASAESDTEVQTIGIYGGTGNDTLKNFGNITADALTVSDAYANSVVTLFNNPHAEPDATATARAYGMDGGYQGSKVIHNHGNVIVIANAGALPGAVADSGTATTYTEGWGLAQSFAAGMRSDGETSTLINFENSAVTVQAKAGTYDTQNNIATSYSDEESVMTAGNFAAGTPITADSVGIQTFSGNDTLENNGILTISADAKGGVYAKCDTTTLDGHAIARSTVLALATGAASGTGANTATNTGVIQVSAVGNAAPSTYGFSRDYTTTCTSEALSNAKAFGMIGDGTLVSTETGKIIVFANALSYANALTNSEHVYTNATLNALATGFSPETNIDLTDLLIITNKGETTIKAFAGEDENGTPQQMAWSSTDINTRNCDVTATGKAFSDAAGVRAGDGEKRITNTGTLTVASRADANLSNYNGQMDAHIVYAATAQNPTATAYAESNSLATGVLALAGENTVANSGNITVSANTTSYAFSKAYSNWSDCYAHTRSNAVANSRGIVLGDDKDTLTNAGNLTVTAFSLPNAGAYSTEYIYYHTVSSAAGTGMDAGSGENTLINNGVIDVAATSGGSNYFADDGHDSASLYLSSSASAVGMVSGIGDDMVRNTGNLSAKASASYYNVTFLYPANFVGATALGISSSDGDDTIFNSGTIFTQTMVKTIGTSSWSVAINPGIAIDAGAGNDTVELANGSHITGDVRLSSGDDTLILKGTISINGNIDPGTGDNTLVLGGEGTSDKVFTGFNRAAKTGNGTFVLSGLSTVNQLSVERGRLQVITDYRFADTGQFSTPVLADGSHGQLDILGIGTLDGGLKVLKEEAFYSEAQIYDIITANALNGAFDKIQLPESTPLLDFSMERLEDRVQIFATPQSCTTFAQNSTEADIAGYLDSLAPKAKGDLKTVLKTFQQLSPEAIKTAFSGFSPGSYGSTSVIGHRVAGNALGAITSRLQTRQNRFPQNSQNLQLFTEPSQSILIKDPEAQRRLLLGHPDESISRLGFWAKGHGRWGVQDGSNGFSGYNFQGFGLAAGTDYTFNNCTLGVGIDQSKTDFHLDADAGHGEIRSLLANLYADYRIRRTDLTAIFGYGVQSYENTRNIILGNLRRTAQSNHDAGLFSVFLGAEYPLLSTDLWQFTPFANAQYTLIDEEGFTETGAGDLNLVVPDQTTRALVSQWGLRMSRPFNWKNGELTPTMSLAGIYDFDVDDQAITAGFSGSPGDYFTTDGQDVDRWGISLETGCSWLYKDIPAVSLNYRGEFRKSFRMHTVTLKMLSQDRYTTSLDFSHNFKEGQPEFTVMGKIQIRF